MMFTYLFTIFSFLALHFCDAIEFDSGILRTTSLITNYRDSYATNRQSKYYLRSSGAYHYQDSVLTKQRNLLTDCVFCSSSGLSLGAQIGIIIAIIVVGCCCISCLVSLIFKEAFYCLCRLLWYLICCRPCRDISSQFDETNTAATNTQQSAVPSYVPVVDPSNVKDTTIPSTNTNQDDININIAMNH